MSLGTGDMFRVTTLFGGTGVQGGGIQQFYFDLGGGTEAQALTAVKAFWNAFTGNVGTGLTMQVQSEVEQVNPEDGAIILVTAGTGATYTGSGSTSPLPPHVQGLLRFRTGVYEDGKEVRGRVYIPSCRGVDNVSGAPTSSIMTAWETAGNALIADANSTLVIYRRERQERAALGVPGQPGYRKYLPHRDGGWAPVSSCSASSKWASLRSRRD